MDRRGHGRWLIVATACLLGGAIAFLWPSVVNSLLYFPSRGLDADPKAAGLAYEDVEMRTSDGERLHGIVRRAPSRDRARPLLPRQRRQHRAPHRPRARAGRRRPRRAAVRLPRLRPQHGLAGRARHVRRRPGGPRGGGGPARRGPGGSRLPGRIPRGRGGHGARGRASACGARPAIHLHQRARHGAAALPGGARRIRADAYPTRDRLARVRARPRPARGSRHDHPAVGGTGPFRRRVRAEAVGDDPRRGPQRPPARGRARIRRDGRRVGARGPAIAASGAPSDSALFGGRG